MSLVAFLLKNWNSPIHPPIAKTDSAADISFASRILKLVGERLWWNHI